MSIKKPFVDRVVDFKQELFIYKESHGNLGKGLTQWLVSRTYSMIICDRAKRNDERLSLVFIQVATGGQQIVFFTCFF